MKICMISYSRYYDTRVQRYARALTRRGDRVDFICLATKGIKRYSAVYGIRPYPLLIRNYIEKSAFSYLKQMVFFFILSTITCTRLHLINRYDIIHFHNLPDFGIFCTIIPKLMGARVILDIHDIVPEFYMRKFSVSENHWIIRFLKWIEKLSCCYADHIITVTEIWQKRLIQRSVQPEKCTVILNAPDPDIFKPIPSTKGNNKENRFTVGYHGTLTEPTGVDIAIKAIAIIKERIPEIRFLIVGEGREENHLWQLIHSLQLRQYINFWGRAEVDCIPKILKNVDIGIDPKRDGIYSGETLSVKAMEYLAMGVPLIISKTKAAKIYFDHSMVLFFEPDNEHDLAQCILKLYQMRNNQKMKMVENANRFTRKHSWRRYESTYYHLIDTITNAAG